VKAGIKDQEVPPGLRKFLAAYPEAPAAIVYAEGAPGEVECEGRLVWFRDISEAEDCPFLSDTFAGFSTRGIRHSRAEK
jgi:hypothetical protein